MVRKKLELNTEPQVKRYRCGAACYRNGVFYDKGAVVTVSDDEPDAKPSKTWTLLDGDEPAASPDEAPDEEGSGERNGRLSDQDAL